MESSTSSKLRLMCSYNGHIIPRPNSKSLSYTGGETRIVSIDRRISFHSLINHLSKTLLNNRPFHLKYQIPNEDLDSLISVTTDEDLDNMIDEHDRVGPTGRIRLFLFPVAVKVVEFGLLDPKSDSWFCDALKGTRIVGEKKGGPDSFVLESCSSLGSTGSSLFSMSNVANNGVAGESCVLGLLDRRVRVPSSASFVSSDNNSPGGGSSPPKVGLLQDQTLSSSPKTGLLLEQTLSSPPKTGLLLEQTLLSPPKTGLLLEQTLLPPPQSGLLLEKTLLSPPQSGQLQEHTLSSPPKAGQLEEQTTPSPPKAGQLQEQTLSSPPKAGQLEEQTTPSPPKAGQLLEQITPSPPKAGQQLEQTTPSSPKAGQLHEKPLIEVSPDVPLVRTNSETSPPKAEQLQEQITPSPPRAEQLHEKPLIEVSPDVPLVRTKFEISPETTVGVQTQTQTGVSVLEFPFTQAPDGQQFQQQEPQLIQGGVHYQPQYAVNQMPVTSYYPVYQMPMQQQPPVHFQPNQPYPIYFIPVRLAQYHNMPMQYALTDGSNYSSSCGLQLHTPAATITSNGGHNEMFRAQTAPEATINGYRNIPSIPLTPDSAASATQTQCNEFEEDIVYSQIFKSQPPAPVVLPAQYQPMTNGVPVMLSESSVQLQQNHVKEQAALHPT